MIVGNDIVYLKASNCLRRHTDDRFKSKILSNNEQIILDQYYNDNNIIWLMWSIKEAVYKCCKRYDSDCLFAPAKFELIHLSHTTDKKILPHNLIIKTGTGASAFFNYYAEAQYHQSKFFAYSIITSRFVYTITCTANNFENIYWGIQKIDKTDYESQSSGVRNFLRDHFLFRKSKLSFYKDEYNRPSIFVDDQDSSLPVSFSHDHQYVGYAFAV